MLRKQRERALLKRLVISYFDLSEARQFLLCLRARDLGTSDEKLYSKALRTALVVAYARPFSGNRGEDGSPDPLPERLLKQLTRQQLAVHSRVLELRDKEFAHSDAANASVRISVDRWPDGGPFALPISRVTRAELSHEDLRILGTLLDHFDRVMSDERDRIERGCSPGERF
jgi:hypothetical protein